MDKKPYWLHILTETIGIPQIIAILIGVPTMTIFVWSIWQSLTLSHQIIAVTSGCAIMLVISLFIYGQTRKILYVIPDLLYKMNSIVQNHAISINFITDLKEVRWSPKFGQVAKREFCS
jgi:hypothetical protein